MPQRLQVVVDDRLAEAVKALAERDERTVSEWTRLLLDRVVARAESNGTLELPGWCVGCGARAGKGELVCQDCAALMDAEDAARPASGGPRTEPLVVEVLMREGHAACDHDWGDKRQTSFGFVRDCRRGCGEVRKV